MKMIAKNKKGVLLVIMLMLATNIWADCLLNGLYYPEGAVVGGKMCVGGSWK